jgi:hypothetical protein
MSIPSTGLSRSERLGGASGARTGPTLEPLALSIAQTVAATSLSRATVYLLIKAGKLKIIKIGNRTLVDYPSIKELMRTGSDL